MTQERFRKDGWLKEFAQFDETELATIILCVRSLVEIGVWPELVRYCLHRITETIQIEKMREAHDLYIGIEGRVE